MLDREWPAAVLLTPHEARSMRALAPDAAQIADELSVALGALLRILERTQSGDALSPSELVAECRRGMGLKSREVGG